MKRKFKKAEKTEMYSHLWLSNCYAVLQLRQCDSRHARQIYLRSRDPIWDDTGLLFLSTTRYEEEVSFTPLNVYARERRLQMFPWPSGNAVLLPRSRQLEDVSDSFDKFLECMSEVLRPDLVYVLFQYLNHIKLDP